MKRLARWRSLVALTAMLPLGASDAAPRSSVAARTTNPTEARAARPRPLLRVTIVDAEIAPRKRSGALWDEPAKDVPSVLSPLACAALPPLVDRAATCGAGGAVTAAAPHTHPDPLVRLELADRVIETFPIPNALSPTWNYRFLIDPAALRAGSAHLALLDFETDGPGELIGQRALSASELTEPGVHTLRNVGLARRVTFTVERLPDGPPSATFEMDAPSTTSLVALASHPTPTATGWQPIPIAQGDLVEIHASGEVCIGDGERHTCTGPDGFPDRNLALNDPAFRRCSGCFHAGLVAQLGAQSLALGAHHRFVADTSGLLLVGANDVRFPDATGVYHVVVAVNHDRGFAYGAPDLVRDDGQHDAVSDAASTGAVAAGAAGELARHVGRRQTDVLDCLDETAPPSGTVSLSAARGVVEIRAAGAMAPLGECLRRRTKSWRVSDPAPFPLTFVRE